MCYYSQLCPAHYFLVRSYLPYHCFIKSRSYNVLSVQREDLGQMVDCEL